MSSDEVSAAMYSTGLPAGFGETLSFADLTRRMEISIAYEKSDQGGRGLEFAAQEEATLSAMKAAYVNHTLKFENAAKIGLYTDTTVFIGVGDKVTGSTGGPTDNLQEEFATSSTSSDGLNHCSFGGGMGTMVHASWPDQLGAAA